MRAAEARFSASIITSTSIRLSFVGAHVDCKMNTSRPRTFSSSSTITSPSENRPTTQRPRLMFKCRHTASASFGFALPVKIRIRSNAMMTVRRFLTRDEAQKKRASSVIEKCAHRGASKLDGGNGWGGRDRTYECRNQNPVPYHLATPQRNVNADSVNPPRARCVGLVSDDYANPCSG